MNRNAQLLGIIGLVCLLFGLTAYFLLGSDPYHFVEIHLIAGALLIVFFLVRGGVGGIGKVASVRTGGFFVAAALYTALFLGVLAVPNYMFYRYDPLYFDSTEQKVFTLAPQSLRVLESLPEPVVARAFFLGAEVPVEVKDLLDRMSRTSTNFRWKVLDPERTPGLVESLGISEKDTIHFSFENSDSNLSAKVARVINEQEVVNALLKLSRGEKILYALRGHGEGELTDPTEGGYLFLKEAIEGENVAVRFLDSLAAKEVPEDASALLIVAPKKSLLESEVLAIKRYLSKGGNALFLHETKGSNDIPEILRPLGVEVGNDVVLDQVVQLFSAPGMGVQPVVTSYGNHPIVAEFSQGTVFSTVASVRRGEGSHSVSSVAELAFTSENSWAEKKLELIFTEEPEATLDPEDIKGPVSIAAAFEGAAYSEHRSKDSATIDSNDPTVIDSESALSRIVVFGDADFVSNINIRQLYNRDFFLNSLNWVLGEEAGLTIRAKTLRSSTTALTAEQFRGIFTLTALLLPELVIITGFAVWWFRRS